MHRLIWILALVFTFTLINTTSAQVVWQESFDTSDKGVWASENGELQADFTGVSWLLDYSNCEFSDDGDYAKTVGTSGGRFEVLDSDGEVVWYSPKLDISNFDVINISLTASETGSSTSQEKKYIKTYANIDGEELVFTNNGELSGNWGGANQTLNGIVGDSIQLIIKMNSSYANDKVYVDNIVIEAVDSAVFLPDSIGLLATPKFGFTSTAVDISVAVFNSTGEILKDSTILLEFESSTISVESFQWMNGFYTWSISSAESGNFAYTIKSDEHDIDPLSDSIVFYLDDDVVVFEDFDGSNAQGWELSSDWVQSEEEPIAGTYSIKHAGTEDVGTSLLKYVDTNFKLTEEEFMFSFKLKNGNWNPSSSNSFYFLMSSTLHTGEGILFGVNAKGSSDLFSIWNMKNGEVEELIAETEFEWLENTIAQIDISRLPLGDWSVNCLDMNTGESSSVDFSNSEITEVNELVLQFSYTTSRAGKLWFDDLLVIAQNAAPFVVDASAISAKSFEVFFNEPIQTDKLQASNFSLRGKSGDAYSIDRIEVVNDKSVIIHLNENVNEGYLTVFASEIFDLESKLTEETSIEFENSLPAVESDLIFTEIMADPNPPVNLPESEFLEIYNRSEKFIQLENYQLFVKNSIWALPNRLIAPGEFLILCDLEFDNEFSKMGSTLTFERFPSLLNAGVTLRLSTSYGEQIDEVMFSDEWYGDEEKENGGYSLERIDPNRFCGQRGNWKASEDENGGTPGKMNSVNATNTDSNPPQVLGIDVVSYSSINVLFSESVDSSSVSKVSNYAISGLSISSISYEKGSLQALFNFSSELKVNNEYHLIVKRITDECGNALANMEYPFVMTALEPGQILINEVLFNPFTDGADFVELYNNSGVTVDLADLKLATRDETMNLKSIYDVSFLHARFEPGEFLVFTKDTLNIKETYHVLYEENLIHMEKFPAFGNEEGRVVLLDDSLQVLDELAYTQDMHSEWLTAFDGVSLERVSFDRETNDVGNWFSASSLVGYATPTYENSQTEIEEEASLDVELDSDIVSPNGDGHNDELILKFTLDEADYVANAFIFDAVGREVARITNNDLIGNMNEVAYDLRDENGSLIPMGTYLIYIEMVHLKKKKQVFKKAFLVTDRM